MISEFNLLLGFRLELPMQDLSHLWLCTIVALLVEFPI
jgi:hypothetical protein